MTLQLSTIHTTRETLSWNASEPETSTEKEITVMGKPGNLSISRSAIHISDAYGEADRLSFRYWSDNREVENAVVDFVAALHDCVSNVNNSERGRQEARELLDRILGAAGNA